jgi:hypothetical protein
VIFPELSSRFRSLLEVGIIILDNDLKNDIINYFVHLKKYQFNIHSFMSINNQVEYHHHMEIFNTVRNLGKNNIS